MQQQEKSAITAFRGYRFASKTAKVLRVAHVAAMGAAAASLVVGGVRIVKRFRGE